jgi:CRP/FNR family cyclic AMP-dependent transcriptional regulator
MSEQSLEQIIADNRFFAGLDEDARAFLAANAEDRELAEGKVLFHRGDKADHFYLILEGHLSLEIPAIEGPALQLQDIGPGKIAGWSWLIPPNEWRFQARASSRLHYLAFNGTEILRRSEEDPRFGYEIIRRFSSLMSERLDFARQKMMQEWKPLGFA